MVPYITTFMIGMVIVLGGIDCGVLFVPIIGGFFLSIWISCTAVGAGTLSAGPALLRSGMAYFRLAIPQALIASAFAIVGAMIGLRMSSSTPLRPQAQTSPWWATTAAAACRRYCSALFPSGPSNFPGTAAGGQDIVITRMRTAWIRYVLKTRRRPRIIATSLVHVHLCGYSTCIASNRFNLRHRDTRSIPRI